jgi:thiol-disulfide isomerase/thioredoxin
MSYVRHLAFSLTALGLLVTAGPAGAEDPAPAAPAPAVQIPWVKVWADAKAQAKKENKDLLIDFTGSDWCGWCTRLEEEVFSQAKFLETATKKYVFVYLDFPHGADKKKEVVDPALNESLRGDLQVRGFPTIILANAEGLPYARAGYEEGGPEGYLTYLDGFKPGRDSVANLLAKGKQDVEAFKAGFQVLDENQFLGSAGYAWVLDQAVKHDPDGSKGLKAAAGSERERQVLMKILRENTTNETRMPKVHEFLKTSKDLRGQMLWQASKAVGDWLMSDKKDYVEAKRIYQLPMRDPEVAANEDAKTQLAEWLKALDEVANPKPPEPKPADPKPGTTK